MTDQQKLLSKTIADYALMFGHGSGTTLIECRRLLDWAYDIAALESQLAANDEANEQQGITLDAVADLCGEALGTAREYRSPIGCASALANYVGQLHKENAAMREAGKLSEAAMTLAMNSIGGCAWYDEDDKSCLTEGSDDACVYCACQRGLAAWRKAEEAR